METPAAMRVDKWLWAARAFKTRSLASDACGGGKVDVNGEAAKPAKPVRGGDRIEITIVGGRRILKVLALSERRGPATEARLLYEDLTPPAPPRARQPKPPYRPPGAGRPTKRQRREIDRLRSTWGGARRTPQAPLRSGPGMNPGPPRLPESHE